MMHTAQHIFSALAEDLWGCETVGNQIGAEQSRVDLLFEDKDIFNPEDLIESVKFIEKGKRPFKPSNFSITRGPESKTPPIL